MRLSLYQFLAATAIARSPSTHHPLALLLLPRPRLTLPSASFPIVCDTTGEIATALTATSGCHVIYAAASRSILFDLQYPSTAGRNFHEILRLVDAVAHTKATGMHTPVNWIKGGDTCVPVDGKEGGDATVIDLPSLKPYLRMVAEK